MLLFLVAHQSAFWEMLLFGVQVVGLLKVLRVRRSGSLMIRKYSDSEHPWPEGCVTQFGLFQNCSILLRRSSSRSIVSISNADSAYAEQSQSSLVLDPNRTAIIPYKIDSPNGSSVLPNQLCKSGYRPVNAVAMQSASLDCPRTSSQMEVS